MSYVSLRCHPKAQMQFGQSITALDATNFSTRSRCLPMFCRNSLHPHTQARGCSPWNPRKGKWITLQGRAHHLSRCQSLVLIRFLARFPSSMSLNHRRRNDLSETRTEFAFQDCQETTTHCDD